MGQILQTENSPAFAVQTCTHKTGLFTEQLEMVITNASVNAS